MQFNVTLTLTVEAPDLATAEGIGIGAAEHLTDTFNDDESINPLVRVEAQPLKD